MCFSMHRRIAWSALLYTAALAATLFGASVSQAQVSVAPPPTVGSSNPVSAEPLVSRPPTTPCTVQLFNDVAFDDFNFRTYSYTPPAACPGPWAKVVFTADFTVSAGVQYDRSPEFYLGSYTIYRGTTAEPGSSFSPSWHVERDLTDYTSVLESPQTGILACGNLVNAEYTGIIYANGTLEFYPASASVPLPTVPDVVIPMIVDPTYPSQVFSAPAPKFTVTLPKNTTQMYMDLTSQVDEFWWLSTPNAQVAPLVQNVDATALREMDVSIDGVPAGVAPNHPYVFTGGADPFLWIPITGAQTLNLKPYRINLTPFAGVVSDGNPHTITIDDINVNAVGGAYYMNADLFVYTDHGGSTVTGAVTQNTLTANPGTTVTSNVDLDANLNGTATVDEALTRSFSITGYVNTSQGKITTTVAETVAFENSQQVVSSATTNAVIDTLTSTVDSTVTTATPSATTIATTHTENPLDASLTFGANSDGTYTQLATIELRDVNNLSGPADFFSNASEDVKSMDALHFDENFNFTGNSGAGSTGTYVSSDSAGDQYSSTLISSGNVLTGVTTNSSSSASTLFISSSATAAVQNSSVTLSATVTPANSSLVPTGYVTFYANGTPLGTVALTARAASLTVANLPTGSVAITASYTGDANFNAETSVNTVTISVSVLAPAFSLSPLTPGTLTLTRGQTGTLTLPVTANATFTGAVAFTCTGAPAESSCILSPGSVTLAPGQTATVSVVVATTAPNNTAVADNRSSGSGALFGGASLAGVLLLLWPRKRGFRINRMLSIALILLGLCSAAALSGCSESDKFAGTPQGSSVLTVTATSGTVTQSKTFLLAVN